MVADFKMKYFRIRGSGDNVSDILTVANVHMHSRTAKKETKNAHLFDTHKQTTNLNGFQASIV